MPPITLQILFTTQRCRKNQSFLLSVFHTMLNQLYKQKILPHLKPHYYRKNKQPYVALNLKYT